MANQSLVFIQKKVDRGDSQWNALMGLSNSFVDDANKSSSSRNHDSLNLKSMDSTRIRGAEMIDTNHQEHKKRCFEKLVVRTDRTTKENVEDVKCALKVEVIDDTALIEATAAVSGFKNSYPKESDVGIGNNPGNLGGSRNPKQETDGKKRRNKGSKKQGKGFSVKSVKEKKLNNQVVEDQFAKQKKIPHRKPHNGFRKTHPKVNLVYRKKDSNAPNSDAIDELPDSVAIDELPTSVAIDELPNSVSVDALPESVAIDVLPDSVAIDVQEHPKVETEKIVVAAFQEPDSNETEQESTMELVETESEMNEDEGSKINPKTNEEEDQSVVCETEIVESKKLAYTREEMEALRFVKEDEQKSKWNAVFDGFSPSVAKEYMSLLSDMNRQPQTQRYNRVVNCGSTSNRHALLSMPPVLPLYSSSTYRKIAPIGQRGCRVNFH